MTMNCAQASDLLLDWKPGTAVQAQLAAHLQACADCAALARQHEALDRAAGQLELRAPPRVWAAIGRATQPRPGIWERLSGALRSSFDGWSPAAMGSLAAAAAVVLLLLSRGGEELAYRASGSVLDSGRVALSDEGRLVPRGQQLSVGAGALLTLHPSAGDRIELAGPALVCVRELRRLELRQGRVRVAIEAGHGGLLLDVPSGQIRVTGTAFTVDLIGRGAIVSLERGRLLLSPRRGAAAELLAGDTVLLAETGVQPYEPEALRTGAPLPGSVDRAAETESDARAPAAPSTASTTRPPTSPTRSGGRASGGF